MGYSATENNGMKHDHGGLFAWFSLHREHLVIICILTITALAHGINMFNFPYYEDDEGTYISQGWAVVSEGKLAPYTYWYDHAPAGWIQIAGWIVLTGGVHTFGATVETGRVLMLLFQIGSTFLVYQIVRKIANSSLIASVSALCFALSAYGIYYHRRVLLDNITSFWMLFSILLLLSRRLSFKAIWLSAIAMGISVLSKEINIVVIPAIAVLTYSQVDKNRRWFAVLSWLALTVSVISIYPLMATLKNELFPTGTLLGGSQPHVSLLGSLLYQASRGKDGGLLDLHSGFWMNAKIWMKDEPLLVICGTWSAILSVLLIKWKRETGILGLAVLSLWAFLGRGGEVIDFYLVPLLPLLAICLGLMLKVLWESIDHVKILLYQGKSFWILRYGFVASLGIIPFLTIGLYFLILKDGYNSTNALNGFTRSPKILWQGTQAVAQRQAIAWVEKNIPPNSKVIIDMYMWDDLHAPLNHLPAFRYANYYWKVDFDPAIQNGVFQDNWRTIDYIISTPQLMYDSTHMTGMTLVQDALKHTSQIAKFNTEDWEVNILKVNKGGQVSVK